MFRLDLILNIMIREVACDLQRVRLGIQISGTARPAPEQGSFRVGDQDAAAIFCKADLAAGSNNRPAHLTYGRKSIFHFGSLLPVCTTTGRQFHIAQAIRRSCSACAKAAKSCQSPGRNFFSSLPTIHAPGREKMGRANGLISTRRPRGLF